MSLSGSLLPEFDHETATTRRVLARVPADRWDWRPHAKSWTLGELSSHIANLLTWTAATLEQDAFDMEPPGQARATTPQLDTPAELLAGFDANVRRAREAIAAADDATFFGTWTLQMRGEDVFTMPKIAVIRSFVMNHLVHHRGQLSVYLRLCDVPVPSIYGPSADETP